MEQVSGVSLFWYVAGFIALAVGARWATMKRASRDYKATKAALPSLRKGFWLAMRAFMGAVMVLAGILAGLLTWFFAEVRSVDLPERLQVPTVATTSEAPAPTERTNAPPQQRTRPTVRDTKERVICFSAECRRQNPE